MSKSEYDKLLNKAQWKRKRQVIFKRDNYTCTVCGSQESLCAHHTYYYKRRVNPWEYPDESLVTMCEDCHNKWHENNNNVFIDNITSSKRQRKVRTKNARELSVIDKYTEKGFNCIKRGYPNFCFYNNDKIFFVMVKRKPRRDTKTGLNSYQKEMISIFKRLGIDIRVEYIK